MTKEKSESLKEFGIELEGLTEEETKELRKIREELYEELNIPSEFLESVAAFENLTEEEQKEVEEKLKDPKIAEKVARLRELVQKSKSN